MRKSRKKILNQLLAVTLSVSMGAPNIVAMADPVIDDPDGGTKTELLIDDEKVSDKDTQGETKDESKDETENESKDETKDEIKDESKDETKDESKDETKDETKDESKDETKDESKNETKDETKTEIKNESNKTLSEKVPMRKRLNGMHPSRSMMRIKQQTPMQNTRHFHLMNSMTGLTRMV